jgi:two-component system, chemotaxis family, sensor kinase Cph1
MSNPEKSNNPFYPLYPFERYIKFLVVLWTILIAASLSWSIFRLKKETLALASIQADITLAEDKLYRRWNAMHGGVYVPITKETQPNPYLSDVADRDITTLTGKHLTLINPAYMTRQVHDLMGGYHNDRGHITSLHPIRSENAPDAWEAGALRTFEEGKRKVSSISHIKGEEFFRSMTPLTTEKQCLKCHAKQGYHEGDIRGGISVSIPMEPFRAIENRHIFTFSGVHILLWAAGLVGIGLSRQRIRWSEKDRMQAVEDLRKEKDNAQKYLDIAAVMLVVIDSKQNITLINKKGCEILGYGEEEIVGKHWFDNFVPDYESRRVKEVFIQLISGQKEPMEYFESRVLTKSGTVRLIAWHNTVLRDEEGTIVGTLSSGEDITERKQAEEEMNQLTEELRRSNEDLNQFASFVAHDLKTPLNGIGLFANYLSKHYKGRLDGRADEAINYMYDTVERTKMLINDLLAYSRIYSGKNTFRSVNCSVTLEEAISNLRAQIEESGAELTYDLLPTIHGDASQLISLFQNLISNAIKFRSTRTLQIHISAEQKGDEWIFSVRDNGIGIEAKFFDQIFNVFRRLHTSEEYEGTGIGLAICKKVVERHGGRIWVESEPNRGTTIYFTIPAKLEVEHTQSVEAEQL